MCVYIYINTPKNIFQNHQISSFSSTKISTFPASTTVAPWHSAASAAVAIDALGGVSGVSAMRRPAKWDAIRRSSSAKCCGSPAPAHLGYPLVN